MESVILGFSVALQPANLVYCFVGVFIGTLIGVLPGIGPTAGIALLLPATYHLSPVSAIIMLAGIYYGTMYGGSTTSILVNIPGEAASVVTCLDGYQMAQQGRAGPALGIAAFGSFIAGTFSIVCLSLLAPPLATVALKFGPPEYCSLMLLGMTLLIYLTSGSILKALLMAVFGAFLGTVGIDMVTGEERFSLGIPELQDGIGLVPMAMGLFGISEVLINSEITLVREIYKNKIKGLLPTAQDWVDSTWPMLRGSILGFFIGIIPGGGGVIASFISYAVEKKFSKHPERANRYVRLARKIAMKTKVRLTDYRTKFCKHCYNYFKPGVNCRVRTKNRRVVYYCLNCKRYTKFPYLKEKRGVRRAKKAQG